MTLDVRARCELGLMWQSKYEDVTRWFIWWVMNAWFMSERESRWVSYILLCHDDGGGNMSSSKTLPKLVREWKSNPKSNLKIKVNMMYVCFPVHSFAESTRVWFESFYFDCRVAILETSQECCLRRCHTTKILQRYMRTIGNVSRKNAYSFEGGRTTSGCLFPFLKWMREI